MLNINRSREESCLNYEKPCVTRSNKELENQSRQCDFPSLIQNKSYIAISGSVLDSIITNRELSNNEKLYYIVADSLALINANSGKHRSIALSGDGWGNRLDCTRSQIFSMQKSLEKKGFFIIHKDKNNIGQNKRNIIIPTLPQEIFDNICQNSENIIGDRVGGCDTYNPITESMRSYLDRTKLFIKINYDLLSGIISHNCLSSFQKIIWLDFYLKSYKRHIFSKGDNYNTDIINVSFYDFKNNIDFSFINSQLELANRYSCTKKHISKSINILKDLGFINYEQFYIKHQDHNNDNDRQDKSLYKISISLPFDFLFRLGNVKNRSNIQTKDFVKEDNEDINCKIDRGGSLYINGDDFDGNNDENKNEIHLFKETIIKELMDVAAFYDPPFSKIRPLLNKDLKLNIKILDLTKKSKIFKNKEIKKLTAYLPLANSDLVFLKEQSGYNIDFIEKLSYKLAVNYPERSFYSKKGVIQYLSIVLKHEKRNRYTVSQGKFRFFAENEQNSKFKFKIRDKSQNTISLDDFIPFNENILKEISRKIDFKYSNHFINKLAKHINHKYPDIKFRNEKSLINYMVKSLDHEMRNPKDVNRNNFIFRWELEEIEKYEILAEKDKIEQNGILEKFRMNNHIQYKDRDLSLRDIKCGIDTEIYEDKYVNTYKHIHGSDNNDNKITPNFYNLSESETYNMENEIQEGALPISNIIEKLLRKN